MQISVVIPAKNESSSIGGVVSSVLTELPGVDLIVVDDGSDDGTGDIAKTAGAKVIRHAYSKGNGASIKSGARAATGEIIIFMDGDGQHNPADIPRILDKMATGYDMVVGARSRASQATVARGIANRVYNWLATKVVGHKVEDLTSGFRAVRRNLFMQCLYLLPNGFSYPTTSTMAFFRSAWTVGYIPIVADKRIGNSHISPLKDGVRFLLIIFKVTTLYSPLKIFFPASAIVFIAGIANYLYTFFSDGRFTNMSAVMLMIAVVIFLLGLVAEQITMLLYQKVEE